MATPWTGPADLRSQLVRLWERGRLGRAVIDDALSDSLDAVVDAPDPDSGARDDPTADSGAAAESDSDAADGVTFPHRLRFRSPSGRELGDRFDDARSWSDGLGRVTGVRIERRRVNHRLLGANNVPAEAWVDSLDDALTIVGRHREADALRRMARLTHSRRPEAVSVLRRRPVALVELAEVWERLLDLVDWVEANPAPGIYLRQVDLPGVDTKLIESHRAVLAELVDVAIPAAVVDPGATGVRGFERRYGFASKPNLVRFRVLDRSRQVAGLPAGRVADVSVDAATFAAIDLDVDTVFLVENEINFLAFPEIEAAMVVWVAGFGTERLGVARWLDERSLWYWGDIDTHGFAILDELRRRFPSVESFLMDRQTLLDHRDQWATEPRQERRDLPRLTAAEAELYDDLRHDRLGERVRLEQERIAFGRLLADLAERRARPPPSC